MQLHTANSTITQFRVRLKAGDVLVGAGVTLADPLVSDCLGDSVDFLWIDTEHSAMSPEAVNGHLLAARARGVPGLVRVAGSGARWVKPVLDAGADGIVVPQVRSAEEVRQVVSDCRYPPLGRRGYGPRVPSNYGRDGGDDFVRRANSEVFVAVMMETREALDEVDDIVSIAGLDSVVVGPMDLSGSLGLLGQVEHPVVVSAIETIIRKARAAGVFVGAGMALDPEYACLMAGRGVQWLQVAGDCVYMVSAMDQVTTKIRAGLRGPDRQ